MTVTIRRFEAADKNQWNALWQQYLVFYEHTLSDAQTDLTWSRLLTHSGPIFGLAAEENGTLVGFTHYSFTHSTWEEHPDIYLEDLFVDPSTRGSGVGRALIDAVTQIAKDAKASRVHWITQQHNTTARKLYDTLATLSEFVIYEKPTS